MEFTWAERARQLAFHHDEDSWGPDVRWALAHKSALVATFVLAYVWFVRMIPAVSSDSSEKNVSVALTSAIFHTCVVGVGFIFGRDLLVDPKWQQSMAKSAIAFFCLFGLIAWLLCSQTSSLMRATELFPDSGSFSVFIAGSTTLWLMISMLVPHTQAGRACVSTPLLYNGFMAAGMAMHLSDVSPIGCIGGFCAMGTIAMLASTDRKMLVRLQGTL
uniref:Uncharacterized protein n=1 Tax=Haptolina brevifila TaxID=156173 RepID=A0A7S2DNC6_9EUKA|mmetsp:Transcript_41333/g.82811  ORF Transcript_41333/g.82811 Transcript_41333/m.82811 type:complete len:217 (+) Transcript_41333:58-708(+)|eukprot:CAMPEP_0174694792 /NCGR_PEP_ID=MMETSP1094-20130205/1307_1 /TAXON_ID=156173 /ORGANISM="Chrysochromulina brevifilum, Strain UTEX LB 985" /LENGTH=216 /DNA_ID=CAMNT_0015891123 /DNA_START=53 /DNA_END=703 /DNA_ORIENTATION=-